MPVVYPTGWPLGFRDNAIVSMSVAARSHPESLIEYTVCSSPQRSKDRDQSHASAETTIRRRPQIGCQLNILSIEASLTSKRPPSYRRT
jgi:hypothetical protein